MKSLYECALSYKGINSKLGTHKVIVDMYNAINPLPQGYKLKTTDSWCMAFVSAMADKCGKPTKFPYECSCARAITLLQKEGIWVEDDNYVPAKNDLVFYHWGHGNDEDCGHTPNHVGIVGYVEQNNITTIEGNYASQVKSRIYPIGWSNIRGYGRTSAIFNNVVLSNYEIAHQVIMGMWGDNPYRRERLEKAGYDYAQIQSTVNVILENNNPNINGYSVSEIALQVIRGLWGNNPERKQKIIAEGYDYDDIMEMVNNYYKEGKLDEKDTARNAGKVS